MEDDQDKKLRAEQEAQMMEVLSQMSPNEQADFAQLMEWIVQRPKDGEPLTNEMVAQAHEEIRLENIRRRLGGKVGEILPFKKAEPKE